MMAHRTPSAPRHTGLAILSIVSIPFAAVTSAAWLGDVASSTDPRDTAAGAVAMIGGLAMGMLVRRLLRSVEHGVRSIASRVIVVARRLAQRPAAAVVPSGLRIRLGLAPALVFVPAQVGRRGPPVRVA